MGKIEPHRRPSLWVAVPIVMALTIVWTNANYPLDYWLHINNGHWMAANGQLIQHDTFSHTIDGQQVSNQPWLAQLLMYPLHRAGGYALNQFIAGLGYSFGVATVIWLVVRRCGNWTLAAYAGCVSVALMSTNVGVRPQYFSVVLFSSQLLLLVQARNTKTVAIGCFVVAALWTNLHGAYPLSVVVPGIFLVATVFESLVSTAKRTSHRITRFACACGASVLGCFVRPAPLDTITYVTNCGSRSVERGLVEWMPTSLDTTSGTLLFSSVVLLICILCLSRRRSDIHELFFLSAFLILACSSQRMVIWWSIVMPIMAARPADAVWRRTIKWFRKGRSSRTATTLPTPEMSSIDRAAGMAVLACLVGFAMFSTPWTRSSNFCLPPSKRAKTLHGEPQNLVSHLANSPINDGSPKRSLAPLSWGSYLTWHSDGQLKSFLDTRVDFFPPEVWNAYERILSGGESALELLDQYDVDVVACEVDQDYLIHRLQSSPRWNELYTDEVGTVFSRL